ncbi:uncharacterized protein LOC108675681 [Hyalella azteca]|uniref:Kinetochore protein Spc24 n=1 Tax=Hyalella azteca TaxID=294128 RepID=A0A8B7NZJ8_HYAAZ|nr:uncharacterized protein LOC108675681 [Hyalella azteca]
MASINAVAAPDFQANGYSNNISLSASSHLNQQPSHHSELANLIKRSEAQSTKYLHILQKEREENIQEIQTAYGCYKQFSQEFDLSQEELKETIQGLLRAEAAHQKQLDASRTAQDRLDTASLKAEIEKFEKIKDACNADTRKIEEQIMEQQRVLASIAERCKQLSSNKSSILPKIKKKINLYTRLTHITWKYNSPENEVCGFVARPERKETIPFKLNTQSNSEFFISNFLWDQLTLDSTDFD